MSLIGKTIGAVVVLGLVGGSYVFFQQKKQQSEMQQAELAAKPIPAPTISVSKITMADFVETSAVSGSLVAREDIAVMPEVDGYRVTELLAEEGQTVKKGEVLARLVAIQLDAQVAQNAAGQARSEAAIAQAKSQIVEAEARSREAKAQLERAAPLVKSGYLSGAVYDQRKASADTAAAQVIAARDGLRAAEADREQVIAQGREVAWRRGNTEIKAPADGIISKRNARIGATVVGAAFGSTDPMFRIVQRSELELDGEIVETELPRVKPGQTAVVTVPGYGEFEGTVRLVAPEVDRTTRLGRVRIFLGVQDKLRVGSFATARIETAKSRGLAAPVASVTFDATGTHALVVTASKVERRELKTGLISGERVEITAGLQDGDLIVTRAGTFLRDGDLINPVLPSAALSEAR